MSIQECGYCDQVHCQHNCSKLVDEAVAKERARIVDIIVDESRRYSNTEELLRPSVIALVFANGVTGKINP